MSKYSYEQKLAAVLRVLEEHMSPLESAKILGTAYEHVRRWVKRYENFGPEGLMSNKSIYTGDFKISVIKYMHKNSFSLSDTANKFNVSDTAVARWERIFYEEGPEGLFVEKRGRNKMSSKKIKKPKLTKDTKEDLIAEVQRLRMENEYLKKLHALVQKRISQENKKKY